MSNMLYDPRYQVLQASIETGKIQYVRVPSRVGCTHHIFVTLAEIDVDGEYYHAKFAGIDTPHGSHDEEPISPAFVFCIRCGKNAQKIGKKE